MLRYTHARTHTHMHTLTHTLTPSHTHAHTPSLHTHIHKHTHTHTHKHTPSPSHPHTQGNKLRKSKTTVNVYSLRTNKMKHLTKEVFGRFTTDHCYNQMYLTDMIKHLRYPIPIKAHLYIDFMSEEPLPDYLTTELVTIENVRSYQNYNTIRNCSMMCPPPPTHTHTHTDTHKICKILTIIYNILWHRI